MSKRFGRNQKRALTKILNDTRDHNRSLESNNLLLRDSNSKLRDSNSKLRDKLDYIDQVATQYSGLLPPDIIDTNSHIHERYFNIHKQEKLSSLYDITAKLAPIETCRLPVMVIESIEKHTGKHFYVRFKDKTWGYAVSDDAIYVTPTHLMVENISRMLAISIAKDLKNIKK